MIAGAFLRLSRARLPDDPQRREALEEPDCLPVQIRISTLLNGRAQVHHAVGRPWSSAGLVSNKRTPWNEHW